MINYSIPKPHPLAGHFIFIPYESEYHQMQEIAEGCGFKAFGYTESSSPWHKFDNDKTVVWVSEAHLSGQEITLDELRELAELSKIKLPCEMEAWDDERFKNKRHIIDFYKGRPVAHDIPSRTYYTWRYFRLPNHRAGEIKAQIKEHQEAIDKLNQELEGIK